MGGKYMPEWFYIDDVEGTGKLDVDDIKFDKAIKEFVGSDLAIDATAVLVGDVTASYKPLYSSEDPLSSLGKFTSYSGSDTHNDDNGGSGSDTHNDDNGGAGGDTLSITSIAGSGIHPVQNWGSPVASITLSIADLNNLTAAETFTVGDLGVGAQGGAFLQIMNNGGVDAATTAATDVPGTFIYDSNTGNVIFDVNGDTFHEDLDTGHSFGNDNDDIIFATLGTGGPDLIDAGDFLFIA